MAFIATYGTLRRTMYNNNRFPMEYMMTRDIPGFQLYDLGPYPMVIKTGDPDDVVTFEIFQVTSRTKGSIDDMEIGAGYMAINVPVSNEIMATVYAYNRIPQNAVKIQSGDYVEYIHQNKKQTSVAQRAAEIDTK